MRNPLPSGLNGMGASDRLHAGLRKSEVAHLALLDQIFDGPGDIFDWDVRVDAVLVKEVDAVGSII